jgi:hypothetical protein
MKMSFSIVVMIKNVIIIPNLNKIMSFITLLWGHTYISTVKAKLLIIDDDEDINNLFKHI